MELTMIQYLLVSLIVVGLCWLWWRSGDPSMPPSPSLYEVITTMIRDSRNHVNIYRTMTTLGLRHGGIFTAKTPGRRVVVISDWTILRNAFGGQAEVYADRPHDFFLYKLWENKDIIFSDGPMWKEKRRFTMQQLKRLGFGKTMMEDVILSEVSKLLDDVIQQQVGHKVLINDLFFRSIFNILYHILAGKTSNNHEDEGDDGIKNLSQALHDLVLHGKETCIEKAPLWQKLVPLYANQQERVKQNIEKIKKVFGDEIECHSERQKSMRGASYEPRDFIDAFLNEIDKRQSKPETMMDCYSRDHLIGIAFNMVEAGIDTAVATLEWSLLYMALWPEIQETVQQELDRVVGRDRLPTYKDISLMPYMEATILEIQRFASVVPIAGPYCTTRESKLEGFTIPAKVTVLVCIWAIHNDPKLWGDPEVFRPERFLNANGKVEKPEYFIPFNLGARKCIGESFARVELFLFLSCLLQRFSFSYASGEPPPTLKAKFTLGRTMRETLYLIPKER